MAGQSNGATTEPGDGVPTAANGSTAPPPPQLDAGSTVGRYAVLEVVGQGGMGRVLRAYDPKLQREVALKVVWKHVLDTNARLRMLREARAMAQLSHPNVVAVYDAEDLDTGVVIVMEFVSGSTLQRWTTATERSWQEITTRFVAAGRGLAAAHAKGLLHRDFKPANVLVSLTGRVQVTDFGLAKLASATGSRSQDEPSTETSQDSLDGQLTYADAVVGTPRYMPPEQHEGRTLDAAADQYAFCVALWEALCGTPPFQATGITALLIDKQEGPPQWPARLANVPRTIVEALRRGLAVDPAARWPSMAALLAELSVDPNARRKRWAALAAGATVLGLGGLSAQLWLTSRDAPCEGAEQQLEGVWDKTTRPAVQSAMLGVNVPYANDAWERTSTALDRYRTDWIAMRTEACEATAVHGEQSAAMLDLRMACLHRAQVGLGAATQVLASADRGVVQRAHLIVGRLPPLSRCADLEALSVTVEPPSASEAGAVESARVHLAKAAVERAAGRYERGQARIDKAALAVATIEYGPVHTEVAREQGELLERTGQYDQAEASLRTALTLALRWRQWDQAQAAASTLILVVGDRQQRHDAGLQFREVAEGFSTTPRQRANVHTHVAGVLRHQGHFAEALAEYERALELLLELWGPNHPTVALTRNNIALNLRASGKREAAQVQQREALQQLEAALGPHHPHVGTLTSNLANALQEQGDYEEAEALHRRSLALRRELFGSEHIDVATSLHNLANVLKARGRLQEAEKVHRQAGAMFVALLGPEHPNVAFSRNNLANVVAKQGRYAEAEQLHREVGELLGSALGPEHPKRAMSWDSLASVLQAQGKLDEAETEYRRALALRLDKLDAEHPDIAESRSHLADLLLERGDPESALPIAEQAWTRRRADDIPDEQRADTAFILARARWQTASSDEQRTSARALAEQAQAEYRSAGSAHLDRLTTTTEWLASHPP